MAFRNNMRRSGNDRNFDRNNYGGSISRNVNPWGDNSGMGMSRGGGGGGMMPQGGGGGNSNGLNADTLSLANSLISNLLRNQNQNSVPPSLMDLPPSDMRGGYGHGGGGGGSGYRDYDDYDRFDNRMGRPIGNRNAGPGPNRNRRPGGGARTNALKGGIRKANPKDRAKNILAKNSNSNSSKTDTSAVNPINNKEPSEENGKENTVSEGKGQKSKRRDSAYANIPNDLFYCHMCMKHMWDSTSFENHIKGRSHQMMKDGIEESYRLRANMIRQEAKIMEQLKSIEVDRIKRLGKNLKASNQHRDYCTMCDLHFYGNLSAHRKTDGHLNLKKFLHPKCGDCSTEFPNRTDYDDHVLSPGHMQKLATKSTRHDNKKKNQLNILTEVDELPGLKQEREEKKEKTEEGATEKSDGTANENDKEGGEDDAAKVKKEKVEGETEVEGESETPAVPVEEEPADVILDYVEGNVIPIEIDNKIPKYNCNRAIASGMIAKLECYECRICARFFDNEKTAEIHSRTIHHYRQFLKLLNEKSNETKIAQKRAEAAAEEEERRKRQKIEDDAEKVDDDKDLNGSELYDPSEATVDEEENKTTDSVVDEMKKNGDCWEDVDGAIKNDSNKTAELVETKETEPMVVEEAKVTVEEPVVVKEEAVSTSEIKKDDTEVVATVTPASSTPATPSTPTTTPAQATPSKPSPLMNTSANSTPNSAQRPQRNNNHNNRQNSNRNRGGGRGRYNRY